MNRTAPGSSVLNVLKPLLIIITAAAITAGCKTSSVQSGGGAGMPTPPSGGMPSPPSGGMPPPPSGGSSGGSSGPSSGGGMPPPPPPGGGSSGGSSGGGAEGGGAESGGQQGGSEGNSPTSGSGGSGGDVGTVPPPPGQGGSGGADGTEGGESGGDGGDGDDNPFSDADATGDGECGDTGVIPGGIGGMGQAGECIGGGGGGAASESEASSSASGGGGGGGAEGSSEADEGGAAGSVGQFPEESPAERSARLGRELDESLGDFDETLQGEQQDIAAVGRVLEGYDTEGGGGGDGKGGVVSLGSQAGGQGGGPNEGGSVGGNKGPLPKIDGMTQQQIEERTPDDIPVLADDDIIARQLKEAALTEEDPVLRERLWDEYRKYRGILTSN